MTYQVTFVIYKLIVFFENLLVFVRQVHFNLLAAIVFGRRLTYEPTLYHAVTNHPHNECCKEERNSNQCAIQDVVWPCDQVSILGYTQTC